MKSFDEWKEANLDEQVAPTAMGKLEKANLVGRGEGLLQKWIDQMASSPPLTTQRKLSTLAKVAEALGLSPQDIANMGTKVKGAIKKDASAPAAQPPA
jgi:hypothetical protein